ncbi:class I SAM-dependent methyltransferase [Roseateles koreensis]|uniref:Class I SAM-dependent methyltransferase n=1 Tax=Roseateles koreensis TaxID=2987526 RepID=A0ABT5KMW1_9BURK|nr:class I SAM-dependent methyltransferase [Roseateles koreensis]MDC8784258.1 class I SAM-dependent methyltransferase [Roseateles koreensis]
MPLLRWPVPALLSWGLAWGLFLALRTAGLAAWMAMALAAGLGLALAFLQAPRWRRLMVAGGFPLSLLVSAHSLDLPAWAWLLPLVLLALAYPRRSWADAPLFPTPKNALQGLGELAPLPQLPTQARILDAGCGLGHGLRELHRAYPQARVEGIEWSLLLALLARLRCPWAHVSRGDMWAQDWQPFQMVYVFQRPESMDRVWAKARKELAPEAWLVSLDFEIHGQGALASMALPRGHCLWVYRVPRQD